MCFGVDAIHMCDAHRVVIDDVRQVVRRKPVSLHQHLVIRARRTDVAANQIGEHQRDVVRDQHPHDGLIREPRKRRAFLAALADTQPVIASRLLRFLLRSPHLGKPFRRTPAQIRPTRFKQRIRDRLIRLESFGLPVRRVRAADVGAFVPVQPEPMQRVVDLLLAVGLEPRPVGVLDPEDEAATGLPREREIEQRHVCRADMRVAGR
jgi:hypothetical protein